MPKLYALCFALILTTGLLRAQDFQMVGSTTPIANTNQCFQLTPPDVYHQAGAVWNKTPVDLSKSFVVNSKLYFGIQDNGADGIAFVIQNAGLNAIGIDGGGLGYHGIVQSVVIEFDTYQNLQWNWFTGDPVEDHIGFMSQGNSFHNNLSTALKPAIPLAQNIEDGQYHDAKFTWDAGTQTLTVSFLGQDYSYTGDIVNTIFGGNPMAYWGFTASTGSDISLSGATQAEQRVCIIPPPPPTCGQLRTQTPGGWGSEPNGNNPGTYLHANFSSVFGANGLVVGDLGSGKYAKFTTANAITDYLPAGGPAKVLTTSYLNPATEALKNTLVSHLVALTLSVRFDAADASFGNAGVLLGDMQIKSGVFANKSVSWFLAEANKVLAGISNTYSLQQVLDVASAINENYVDGTVNKNYLKCPETTLATARTQRTSPVANEVLAQGVFSVYPNPSAGRFQLSSSFEGNIRVQVLSANGIVVEERNVQASKGQVLNFNLGNIPQGIYMVRLASGNSVQTQKLVVTK